MLGSPRTARRGNLVSAVGMLLAVVATLLLEGMSRFHWILVGADRRLGHRRRGRPTRCR